MAKMKPPEVIALALPPIKVPRMPVYLVLCDTLKQAQMEAEILRGILKQAGREKVK